MKAIKNLGYAALTALTLGIAAYQTKAQDESIKDKGLSFYEYNDKNNNGIVDAGESSKLERVIFEEGENVAIDSKFKSGTGKLYVISEMGKIMKEIPQQYETGVKTPQLLEGLPKGKYTTVFSQDGTGELNGSFMGIVGKGEDKSVEFNNFLQVDGFRSKQHVDQLLYDWNDLNNDGDAQLWEMSQIKTDTSYKKIVLPNTEFNLIYRDRFSPKAILKVTKKKDNSFGKRKFSKKKMGRIITKIPFSFSKEGEYKIGVNKNEYVVMINNN